MNENWRDKKVVWKLSSELMEGEFVYEVIAGDDDTDGVTEQDTLSTV